MVPKFYFISTYGRKDYSFVHTLFGRIISSELEMLVKPCFFFLLICEAIFLLNAFFFFELFHTHKGSSKQRKSCLTDKTCQYPVFLDLSWKVIVQLYKLRCTNCTKASISWPYMQSHPHFRCTLDSTYKKQTLDQYAAYNLKRK